MNILICVFFRAPFGGLHANVFSTARHCVRRGHSVTIVCREGPFREQLADAGIHSIATDYSSIRESVQSVLAQSNRPYDIIHAHPFASRQLALELARELAIPLIMTYHGMYDVTTGLTGSHVHRYHRLPGSQPVARRRTTARGPRARTRESESGSSKNRAVSPLGRGLVT